MRAISLDPALGGGNAMVVADLATQLRILDCQTDYDLAKTEEQLFLIEKLVFEYRPSILIVEFDSQQKGLGNDDRLKMLSGRYGFQIKPHLTRGQKMDEVFGVASMDQSFKLGEIRIPYKGEETQARMAPLLAQLRAWRPDIKTKNLTQDLVMALWFIWRYWMKIRKEVETPPAPAFRPSWLINENAYRGAVLTR